MDKQDYTLKVAKCQEIKKIFSKVKYYLLKQLNEVQMIQRKRTVQDYSDLITAAYLYIGKQLSYRRLAQEMALRHGTAMSAPAWRKRLIKFTPIFLSVCQKCLATDPLERNQNKFFRRSPIFALDATVIPIEGETRNFIYMHTCFSLKSHTAVQMHLTNCHTGESARNFSIEPNALYIADRAYGKTSQMAYVIDHQADFIFRFSPKLVKMYSSPECKEKLDFSVLLSGKTFSKVVYFKSGQQVYSARIIGTPIPDEKLDEVMKRAKRTAQKRQFTRSSLSEEYSKWLFLATSVSAKQISTEHLIKLYFERWQIELFFKRSKSILHFRKLRRFSPESALSTTALWGSFLWVLTYIQLSVAVLLNFKPSDFYLFSLASLWIS